jgi:hypothetical protein
MKRKLLVMTALGLVLATASVFAQSSTQVDLKYWFASEEFQFTGGPELDLNYPTWIVSVNHQFNPDWGVLFSYAQGQGNLSTASVPPLFTNSDEDRRDIDLQVHRTLAKGAVRVGLGYRTLSYSSSSMVDGPDGDVFADTPVDNEAGYDGLYLSVSGGAPLGKSKKVSAYGGIAYAPSLSGNDDLSGDDGGDALTAEFGLRAPLGGEDSPYYARLGYRYQKFSLDYPGGIELEDKFGGIVMGIGTSFD